MNQKIAIVIVVVLALGAATYLWYTQQSSPVPPQVTQTEEEPVTNGHPSAVTISNSIVGTWQSVDDPQFTRTFSANGSVTDRYDDGENVPSSGHYALDGDHVPAQVRAAAGASTVLTLEFPEEALFFIVTKLTADELELVYVGAHGTLRFTRI